MDNQSPSVCRVKLQIFEGPLDLLLHLINKNKIDIMDIPMELITRQYLEYLSIMEELDIAIASEYLLMAATLIHIKSKMLLPRDEKASDPEEDPRMEIVRPLKELIEFKKAARYLYERPILGENTWTSSTKLDDIIKELPQDVCDEYLQPKVEVSIDNLVTSYLKILSRNRRYPIITFNLRDRLIDRMVEIIKEVKKRGVLGFFEIIIDPNRQSIIITFLAILELSKKRKIRIEQEIDLSSDFPEIVIYPLELDDTSVSL